MKNHVIIGTAGHIDHGKTALIKALTGIDADRLKEEKERGITIDIGFAYWKENVTILDVPGHEKLIKNMVAGVNTIDIFVLVIAADDGIMPQTIEHLDILSFFNINEGIVVINKSDLVDEEWLSLVEDEVTTLMQTYGLKNSPIIAVSATTGHNINKLRNLIEKKIDTLKERKTTQPFRLPVDRSFSIKGFGTVVTGTVLSSELNKGDEVEILPSLLRRKVRGLQAHGHDVQRVLTGYRAAVNIQGISKDEIKRGDILFRPATSMIVNEFIGTMRTVSKLPIKIVNRTKVRIYVGTAERLGQLIWFEKDKFLAEDSNYHVRIKLNSPVAAVRHDNYLIRLHSPLLTLAGGIILEINPPKIKYSGDQWMNYFNVMASRDYKPIILMLVNNNHLKPVSTSYLQQKLFDDKSVLTAVLNDLVNEKKLHIIALKGEDHFITEDRFTHLINDIENYLSEFHRLNTHVPGLNPKELKTGSGNARCAPEVFDAALKQLLNEKIIQLEYNLYSLAGFSIKVSGDLDQIREDILTILTNNRFAPPSLEELSNQLGMPLNEIKSIVSMLSKSKSIIQINQDIYLHTKIWQELLDYLRSYFSEHHEMPVTALKEYINTTRKYAIPLFEYLDSQGFTNRSGDVRIKGHNLE